MVAALDQWDLRPGDRVAILATNRPDWHIADMAILSAGLVSVPVYPTSAASQVGHILGHSGCRVCFVEDVDQLSKMLLRRGRPPRPRSGDRYGRLAGADDGFVRGLRGRAQGAPRHGDWRVIRSSTPGASA